MKARYREYAPSAALKDAVRAIFTFSMGSGGFEEGSRPFWSSLWADAHASVVFCSGGGYSIEGLWHPAGPRSHVIGPMSQSRRTTPDSCFKQVGAYFTAQGVGRFFDSPAELADRVTALEDLWGAAARSFDERLGEMADDRERALALDTFLSHRIPSRTALRGGFDLAPLTSFARLRAGRLSVEEMADLAGVSRQHLAREFVKQTGVGPKLYLRLTRFRAVAGGSLRADAGWADLALRAGYADQSHMIADFRRFGGATPARLVRADTFHPFRWRGSRA